MSTLWVILNEDKSAVVEVFETSDADSSRHWDKFFAHKQGTVFCRRTETRMTYMRPDVNLNKWYVNYFYWEDTSRWGYGDPTGMAWSACMGIPEPLKMLEIFE